MVNCLIKYQSTTNFQTKHYFQIYKAKLLTKEVIYYHYKKILNNLGYDSSYTDKKISLHTLRHTAAVHMIEKMEQRNLNVNYDVYIVSIFLGHETIKETEIYIHLPYYKYNELFDSEEINKLFPEIDEYDK